MNSPAASTVILPLSGVEETTPTSSTTTLIPKIHHNPDTAQPESSTKAGNTIAPKPATQPKNFEAAFGTLSASYGWGMGSDTKGVRGAKSPKQNAKAKSSGSSAKQKPPHAS
ncbi:uncharacterized protein B0H18DRAFT_998292 [Fomitopsis serialis]|uniref:uncharacterized protein n=1 Tax=Fomitopsis serialis TaxID=139415 RepID=UPI0020072CE2|nr:uncharacterized protein B0H18DRAFT_998292 [Neoantrodia serialis]KAH9929221.1 hypothetical protein B0H18DRAFT_998292 [Neoantrodia serialis]